MLKSVLSTAVAGALLASSAVLAEGLPLIDYTNPEKGSAAEASKKLGEDVANQLLELYDKSVTPEMRETGQKARDFADQIADESIQKERDSTLEFLGINPNSSTGVYVFLSWSMPIEVMRTYAIEAMWSGGSIIFKGVPPNKELADFVVNDLRQLVYGKGAAANISIDPRLYDAYDVTMVPTIVFTTVRSNMQCNGINTITLHNKDGKEGKYDECPKIDPALYDKMSGAVTLGYALQEFKDGGRAEVSPHLKALSKGWFDGYTPTQSQVGFTGNWDDVLSPSSQMNSAPK